MVGGPDDYDNYNDSCNDYVHAEVGVLFRTVVRYFII